MNIIIDNVDFLNMPAMKYYSYPKTYSEERRRNETKANILSETWIGSQKRDGFWQMLIKDMDGNYYMRSRTESVNGGYQNKADFVPQIIQELNDMPNGTVLLGELYLPNNEGSRKVTSIFNCLKDKCIERQKKNGYLHFYIFDCLAYNGQSILDKPIETRINHYLGYELLDVLKGKYVEIAKYYEGEELWNVLGKLLADGYEGMVIQNKSAIYQPGKRPRTTLKVKKEIENTIDAFIDGDYKEPTKEYYGKTPLEIYPYWFNVKTGEKTDKNKFKEQGMGKTWIPITRLFYLNYAGSISFSVMKDGKPVHIGYISGLPDEIRKGIVDNPEKWIHRVFEISCMEVEFVDNHYSMRHAKVLQERTEKNWQECNWSQIVG